MRPVAGQNGLVDLRIGERLVGRVCGQALGHGFLFDACEKLTEVASAWLGRRGGSRHGETCGKSGKGEAAMKAHGKSRMRDWAVVRES
ncbi:hypothetical protein GCM10011316_11470 [Roseibium aquae]|uniref:Uncharacterized protein n=1 Tax=Roseibium aquae TaxID=1323746 RepID=A0A916WY02_9HYPH|nr:hypothetical protein GCM10011316_11470 [Roseibium aquae]